jgi:hypothetical protein
VGNTEETQDDLQSVVSDLVCRLAGILTVDDLTDPAHILALEGALDALEEKPDQLPADLVEQLSTIKDKAERFRSAAKVMGAISPDIIQKLSESMKAAGLIGSGR